MKNWMNILLIAIIAMATLVGCGKKPKMNLTNMQDPVTNDANGAKDGFGDPSIGGPVLDDGVGDTSKFGAAGNWSSANDALGGEQNFIVNPKSWNGKVYFGYNRSDIQPSERPVLESLAKYLQENPSECLVIEGHTDERGSDEYNRTLGERRAVAVRDYLEKLGIFQDRMFTISYGEDRPAVQDARDESGWKLNRRAQFLTGKKK